MIWVTDYGTRLLSSFLLWEHLSPLSEMYRLLKILQLALAAWQSHPSPAICVLFDFAHFVNFNIHQKGFRMKLILIYMQLKTAHAPQKKSNWFKYELRRTEGAVVASFKSLLVRFHAAQLQYCRWTYVFVPSDLLHAQSCWHCNLNLGHLSSNPLD